MTPETVFAYTTLLAVVVFCGWGLQISINQIVIKWMREVEKALAKLEGK